jgi:TetR/AcrR family transcriptional regulator, tetracycline repressor protein
VKVRGDDPSEGKSDSSPSRRGRPPRIDRNQVISAALSVVPGPVTMQAVADALGVDRKAVSYHVGDRETLLALMASTVFTSEFARVPPPTNGDWRDALAWYAHTIRRALTQLGIHDVFPLEGAIGVAALEQAEFVLGSLVKAGFDVEQAGRAANTVVELAISAARDTLLRAGQSNHPQYEEAIGAMGSTEGADFPVLTQVVVAMSAAQNVDAQFEFNLSVVFAGLATRLRSRSSPT